MGYYSPITIGERIREARKKKGLSQAKFAAKLGMSEESLKTIRKWETGEGLPPMETFLKMCELFNCDAGYLLGEFPLPTKEETDVQEKTGLSHKAIKKLLEIRMEHPNISPYLDQIISHDEFYMLIMDLASAMRYMRPHPSTIYKDASRLAKEISKMGFAVLTPDDASEYWLQQTFYTWKRIINDIWREERK